jgi:translation elongation factor EF-Tu-like GTPase
VGINLRGVKVDQLQKGMMLTKPGSFVPTNHFEVCFTVVTFSGAASKWWVLFPLFGKKLPL